MSNVTFINLQVNHTTQAVFVNKCYYKVADQANYCDTSTFQFDDLASYNVTGTVLGADSVNLNCSKLQEEHVSCCSQ